MARKDGTEHEVGISADDGSVIGSPPEKHGGTRDLQKHTDRIAAAKIDYKEWAGKFCEAVKGARIAELNLDTEKGQRVWEGGLIEANGSKRGVRIDVATGERLPGAAANG
ncbi:hypothetical protein JTF08_09710 [Micrococcaceae bacterium RIT802]|nr:hypothetical protein [Micrococcaceae bacterium RIT 802]